MHHLGESNTCQTISKKLIRRCQNSPCYVSLKNNVFTRLLETSLNKFPDGTPDIVTHSVLQAYIQDTAEKSGVHDLIQYNTDVRNVWKSDGKWLVETVTISTDNSGLVSRESKIRVS